MYGAIVNALLLIFLPFTLGKFISLIRALYNWKSHVVFYRNSSRMEMTSLLVLVFVVSYFSYCAVRPSLSYFSTTKTPIDAPSFLVRNKFRDYVSKREKLEVPFRHMITARRAAVKESTDPAVLAQVHTAYEDLEREYVELEKLSHDLRSNENRRLYLLFGPWGFSCDFCDPKVSWHYALLIAPLLLKDYLLALGAIGFASIFDRKARWRFIAVGTCVILMTYEAYELVLSDSPIIQFYDASGGDNCLTRPEQLALGRNAILLVLCSLTLLIDFSVPENPLLARLKTALKSIEASAVKLQTARLARTAAVGDDTLRKFYIDYQRKIEQEKQHIFNDPDYKKVQAELAHKYNMEKIMEEANAALKLAFQSQCSSGPAANSQP